MTPSLVSKTSALHLQLRHLYWVPMVFKEEDVGPALYGKMKPLNLRQAVIRSKMEGLNKVL